MVFSSFEFLFVFLPISLIVLGMLKNRRSFYSVALLIFSLFFYFKGEKGYTIILLISSLVDFFFGKKIHEANKDAKKKFLFVSILVNLGLLIGFKYLNFIVDQLNFILPLSSQIDIPQIHLPLGISFFTFQSMSYSIDIYYGKIKPSKSFRDFFMYVSMFPQLVAGPIVRYSDIQEQIKKKEFQIELGIRRFVLGLAKKVLIADQAAYFADLYFFSDPNALNFYSAWMGIIAYTIQIYFDFSGYSDMAIGLGHLFGFKFPENFKHPYVAGSIQEFWRRWHISLSSWFRDYLYIPLGGNKKGKFRTHLNKITVFFLCGLWHGASWNFVVWGLLHGAFLTLEGQFNYTKTLKKIPLLSNIYCMLIVMVGWVFFRSEDLNNSLAFLKKLVIVSGDFYFNTEFSLAVLLAAIFFHSKSFEAFSKLNLKIQRGALLAIFLLTITMMSIQNFSPFIYFRF